MLNLKGCRQRKVTLKCQACGDAPCLLTYVAISEYVLPECPFSGGSWPSKPDWELVDIGDPQ